MESKITIQFQYDFEELTESAKDNACDYVRDNWHDLGEYVISDVIESLKALKERIGGEMDYSLSILGDRGEFISFKNYDKKALKELNKIKDECPLTGVCYDISVIEHLMNDDIEQVLAEVHAEGEYIYSNEGIAEMLIANEHKFDIDGNLI